MSSSVPCTSPYAPPSQGPAYPALPRDSPTIPGHIRGVPVCSHFNALSGRGQIILNRPKALNTLSTPLMTEPNNAIRTFAATPEIGAVMLTGSGEAFAAGADIMEVKDLTSAFSSRQRVRPGGGCELAMMTDILYCG